MYPPYFHVCALVAILSLLHVPTTHATYRPSVLYTSFCRCNLSLPHDPSCLLTLTPRNLNWIQHWVSWFGLCIVNRCRLVIKLDKFLCLMFLFAFLALVLDKTRQKHASTNLFEINLRTKTKDCAGSRSVQHLIATVLFLLLKFPGFHNQSLD